MTSVGVCILIEKVNEIKTIGLNCPLSVQFSILKIVCGLDPEDKSTHQIRCDQKAYDQNEISHSDLVSRQLT